MMDRSRAVPSMSTCGNHRSMCGTWRTEPSETDRHTSSVSRERERERERERRTDEQQTDQWRIYIVKFWTFAPPPDPNSFNFVQLLGIFGKIVYCAPPPRGVGAPTSGKSWIRHCRHIKTWRRDKATGRKTYRQRKRLKQTDTDKHNM